MLLTHPIFLWLLPLVPAVALAAGRRAHFASAMLRGGCALALVLALTRPRVSWTESGSTHVTVVELRAGETADALSDRLASAVADGPTILFASRAEVLSPRTAGDRAALAALCDRVRRPFWPDDRRDGVNLAAALQLAGAQVPRDGRGEIRLHAGGVNDHGDAAAEAWRLAGRGIAVRPDGPRADIPSPNVWIDAVTLPAQARIGQTVAVDVEVNATMPETTEIHLTAGDAVVTTRANLPAGRSHVSMALPLKNIGLIPVRAASGSDAGSVRAAVGVAAAATVLLVQDTPSRGSAVGVNDLAGLLGAGVRIEAISPDALAARLDDVDAVILADLPADRLPPTGQAALANAIRNGVGLLLVDGAHGLGNGYEQSALAPLLPFTVPRPAERTEPGVALVLVIDTSGSMKGERMGLTKAVARLAVSHLKPRDWVGVVEFFGGRQWAAPLQPAGGLATVDRAIDRLTTGGGTTLFPAVEEAAFALRNVHAAAKHVVVISDGFVEDAPFAELVGSMAEENVTVSAVQVGGAGGPNMMPDLARWGGGRYYTTPDAFALPDLVLKEPTETPATPFVRGATSVVAGPDAVARGDALAREFAAAGPASVDGYVRGAAAPAADVLLATAGGDPLLVRWRGGGGTVAVLAVPLATALGRGLQDRPAFARALAGLLRQLTDGHTPALRVDPCVRPAGVEVDVTAADFTSNATLELSLTDTQGKPLRHVRADPIAAGRWNVLLPDVTAGVYGVTLSAGGHVAEAAVAVAPPGPATADAAGLSAVAAFAGVAAERAAALPLTSKIYVDVTGPLAAAAIVLLTLHVFVRRRPTGGR